MCPYSLRALVIEDSPNLTFRAGCCLEQDVDEPNTPISLKLDPHFVQVNDRSWIPVMHDGLITSAWDQFNMRISVAQGHEQRSGMISRPQDAAFLQSEGFGSEKRSLEILDDSTTAGSPSHKWSTLLHLVRRHSIVTYTETYQAPNHFITQFCTWLFQAIRA
jgi:hypothetical protein